MARWIAFDIEISKQIPDDTNDWSTLHPLGISCAATWASDEDKPMVWCGQDGWGSIAPQLSMIELAQLVSYLHYKTMQGYTVVGLNTAGFDFRELAVSSMLHDVCKEIAWSHVDLFFHVFCLKGFSPGLDAMAKGMDLPGKTEGIDGAKAPEMWQRGEYGKVLEYVVQDVRTTLDVAQSVENEGWLYWTSKSGRPQAIKIERWLSVAEAAELPLPDTSWMDEPWDRSKFMGWLSV